MVRLTHLYILGLFSLLCFVPFHVQAGPVTCSEDLVGVTVVSPTGGVYEGCVGPEAADSMDGKRDDVIKALCPCFSLKDLDRLPMLSDRQEEEGYILNCYGGGEPSSEYISVSLVHPDSGCCSMCEAFVAVDYTSGGDISLRLETSGCSSVAAEPHPWEGEMRDSWSSNGDCGVVSEAGFAACGAVIMASKWWAMCP